ncbi:hypothetical protein [Tateyamaria sp. ANG-S1]|uniref:hypothetical protein n=1 Tax=Tateyamaria sp. ANG-S1 TaxID=1577905 RepID=UPI00126A40D8|nr:hypothetical protein [Tateyamaria sp. ANG-S1]
MEQALAANVATPKDDEECPLAIFQEMLDEPGLENRDNETDIAEPTEAREHDWLADAFLTFGVQAALHGDFEARPDARHCDMA